MVEISSGTPSVTPCTYVDMPQDFLKIPPRAHRVIFINEFWITLNFLTKIYLYIQSEPVYTTDKDLKYPPFAK